MDKQKQAYIQWAVQLARPMDTVLCTQFHFWDPRTYSALLIRRETHSWCSHVFKVGNVENGQAMAYTTDVRYRKRALAEYLLELDRWEIWRHPGLTPDQVAKGVAACESEIGKFYPVANIPSMILQNFLAPSDPRLAMSFGHVCSQSVEWTDEQMGLKNNPQMDKDYTMYVPIDCVDPTMQKVAGWPIANGGDATKRG